MTMNVSFSNEVEAALRQRAAATGQDVESLVQRLVAEKLLDATESVPMASPAEFAKWLDSWIALHPVLDHAIDDSRESIYAGRGE